MLQEIITNTKQLTYVLFWAGEYKKTLWCPACCLRIGKFIRELNYNWINVNNTMVAIMVAVLVHVHCVAWESKYIKNSIHKCCNALQCYSSQRYCWKHMLLHKLCFAKELSQLFEASMTTLALIRENLRGLGHLT